MKQNASDLRARLDGGLIPAVPVTFDVGGRLHRRAHEAYLAHMSDQPLAGVAVWAHTGRGLWLDRQTADAILSDWRQALPDKVIIAGVGARASGADDPAAATERTLEMAERAARLGADALLVHPPTWLREHEHSGRMIVEHHRRLAGAGLPLILFYLYEEAGGVSYEPTVLDELLALPEVAGIKMATLDSVMTYQDVSRQVAAKYQDRLFITGEDRFLGYSLQRGARAALIGMGAVSCALQARLIKAHLNTEAELFLRLSATVDRLAEATFVKPMEGYIARLLWVLTQQGVIPAEAAHDPWGPKLSDREFAAIGQLVDALRAEGW